MGILSVSKSFFICFLRWCRALNEENFQVRQKKKKQLTLLVFAGVIIGMFFSLMQVSTGTPRQGEQSIETLAVNSIKIILERVYLDGEVSEEIFTETAEGMKTFWLEYDDWNLIERTPEIIILQKYVDDISPLLKINGYFGLTEEGILTIFDGEPQKKQIIQSFYYIDTKKLESTHYENLQKGIPVLNCDHYREVLSMFKQYEIEM